MELRELQQLLRRPEGPKLDFKRDFYDIDSEGSERHWNEFIKDILPLANGNIGYAGEPGYLVIGADDKLNYDGTRKLHSGGDVNLDQQQALRKINSSCNPPVAELKFDKVVVSDCQIFVITVPPDPYLHETIRDLKLIRTSYNKGTVFIRRGDDISNATQEERDAIRSEKQRIFKSARVTSGLERRITAAEIFIEEGKADIAEKRSLSTSEKPINLELLKDEINLEMHILDYLKTKLRFEQGLLSSSAEKSQKSKKFLDYARRLLSDKLPRIQNSLSENASTIIDEIRDDAKNALEAAINYGNAQPRTYLLLMQIYDHKQEPLGAYDLGCEALKIEHEFADLHRFHLKICHFVRASIEGYQEEAEISIEQNKRRLCQILKVEAVDEWGHPQ